VVDAAAETGSTPDADNRSARRPDRMSEAYSFSRAPTNTLYPNCSYS
jgi:hypothetical protein